MCRLGIGRSLPARVAQLEERLPCKQGVRGSIPLSGSDDRGDVVQWQDTGFWPRRRLRFDSSRPLHLWFTLNHHGLWRSLVARLVRDEEVAGSSPVSPTTL